MRPEDIQPIAELIFRAGARSESRDLHTWDSPAEALADDLRDLGHPVAVVEPGGRGGLVGYVSAEVLSDGTGYIHYLAVDPAFRRRGLGRDLLHAALRWLFVERDLSRVHLTVAERNDARHLYAQAGFSLLSSGQTMDWYRGPG